MKYLIGIIFFAALASIICGFVLQVPYSEKLIGFGVVALFFVVIPMFSYRHWKDKDVKDYMLTKENLESMRKREGDKRKL
ncbi:membrane protein [Tamlana sedimentorum]|uniref:Membrane protein n=1 Tax=Neotamlana sedimentorum TaxID=1435349 RepID=A0A0D7W7U2_9FLAO|nr:hypothetical protein [Tamlana sedimentorum]KJD35196.1 membrane protein [Tamlana sedimentorum]